MGAALIEGLDLYTAIHTTDGWPWKKKGQPALAPYLAALVIRLGVGTGLTAAFAASQQVAGALAAVTVGIAAPKILQQLAKQGLAHQAIDAPPASAPQVDPGQGAGTQPAGSGPDQRGGQVGAL
ncbi:hypothetical protein [Streptomyces sp. A5-4]|uniref:hypothetical protein n=1 Tax=Streptomyces sp. A5-4 TaxID=3384771 RepID=UPI003DA97BB6